jgi:hypothetical protein
MGNIKISTVLTLAADLVLSRDGDVTTEDGDYATCGTDEMIRLDCAIAELLELPSDDVNCVDTNLIYHNAEKYDKLVEQVELLTAQKEALIEYIKNPPQPSEETKRINEYWRGYNE